MVFLKIPYNNKFTIVIQYIIHIMYSTVSIVLDNNTVQLYSTNITVKYSQ